MSEFVLGERDTFESSKTPIPPQESPTTTKTSRVSKPGATIYQSENEVAQPETAPDSTTPG